MSKQQNNMANRPRGSWEPLPSIVITVVLIVLVVLACPTLWSSMITISSGVR